MLAADPGTRRGRLPPDGDPHDTSIDLKIARRLGGRVIH
jgi:hypothetical protein